MSPKARATLLHSKMKQGPWNRTENIALLAREIRESEARGVTWAADFMKDRGATRSAHLLLNRVDELRSGSVDLACD